jgi:hypothetical protein
MYDIISMLELVFGMMGDMKIYVIYCITITILLRLRMGMGRMSVRDALGELGLMGMSASCAGNSGTLALTSYLYKLTIGRSCKSLSLAKVRFLELSNAQSVLARGSGLRKGIYAGWFSHSNWQDIQDKQRRSGGRLTYSLFRSGRWRSKFIPMVLIGWQPECKRAGTLGGGYLRVSSAKGELPSSDQANSIRTAQRKNFFQKSLTSTQKPYTLKHMGAFSCFVRG